jgi:hypothetical protein
MGRALSRWLLRVLVVFLALEVADTPLFCADEQPADAHASLSLANDGGALRSDASHAGDASDLCFCPCHLSFESEGRFSLPSAVEPAGFLAVASSEAPTNSSRGLDHPPQNLV